MSAIGYLATWITRLSGMSGVAMGAMIGYYALRVISCSDDGMVAQYKERIKNCLVAGVVLSVMAAVFFFVGTTFFGVSAGDLFFLH